MPELPEAETIAAGLHRRIAGATVQRVRVHRDEVVEPMKPRAFARALVGRTIVKVGRRAKWISVELDDDARWVTQLRMTGRFAWEPPGRLSKAPHLSASLLVESPRESGIVRFFDVRRFARMWVLSPQAWSELDSSLGIEPLSEAFTPGRLTALLSRSRAPIRNALLDQHRIAGIGNIYASEACHRAGIDPRRPAMSLEEIEAERLHGAIRSILIEAIDRQGTSLSDYRGVAGDEGEFQNELAVYGRAGELCDRCGGVIERAVMAGRSAFFCTRCQT